MNFQKIFAVVQFIAGLCGMHIKTFKHSSKRNYFKY